MHAGGLTSNLLVIRLSIVGPRHPPRDEVLTGEQILPDGTVPRTDILRACLSQSHDARHNHPWDGCKANGFAFPRCVPLSTIL